MNKEEQNLCSITDILLSGLIFVIIVLVIGRTIEDYSALHPYFIDIFSVDVGEFVIVYYLYQKCPLNLSPKISYQQFVKYIIPLIFLNLLLGNFPYYILFSESTFIPKEYTLFISFNTFEKLFFLINLCLLAPILEELVFRGFIYKIFKHKYNTFWGASISAVLFWSGHGVGFNTLPILISGLIFTYTYEKVGNIWASIVVHASSGTLWFLFAYFGINYRFS